jgi:molybdate transport system ATP-binding protein
MLSVALRHRLDGFSLDVSWASPDHVVALVGPSGSGKTLTLQCLAGLLRAEAGRIAIEDRVVFDGAAGVDVPARERRVGYVFQGYALFPHLTVAQNIGYGLHGLATSARRQRVHQMLGRFGLDGHERRRPAELSGGQQQRVALARALATDPDVLLLDEPLSALDAPLRRELRRDLVRTIREWRKPTVLVTHDLAEAYQIADYVVLYEAGRVIDAAPKAELLWHPASERVARLIGVGNLLRGRVAGLEGRFLRIDWRGHRLFASRPNGPARFGGADDETAFFVRPEYVRLVVPDRPLPAHESKMNRLQGTIVADADEGTSWRLFFRLDAEGTAAQGEHDLEIEIPRLVYSTLDLAHARRWTVLIQPSSIQVLGG